jgi:hypothetical protein
MDITEKIDMLVEMKMEPHHLDAIANTLSDKEWFVLGVMIGYKPKARKEELQRYAEWFNVPVSVEDYDAIAKSLFQKKAIQKNKIAPHTRELWEYKFGKKLASQVPHWVKDLKF